jgi:cholesterol oxidase
MVYDYIVIGSGFGGSVASLRLVEKGYKVLTIEQGKRFTPKDFPRSNWNVFKYLWAPSLRCFGFQKLSFYSTASILSGTGVGGGSLVYANTLYIPPDDFFRNSQWSEFGNWKEELKPFFDRASFMLGRTKYDKLNDEDRVLREVACEMNAAHTFESVNVGVNLHGDDNQDPYFRSSGPERMKCVECGGCMVGCRENAKNTLDRNYLWFAEKMGLEILPETKVEKIEHINGLYSVTARKITSIFRKKSHFTAKGIIVAGGTLGTMDLLLRQKYKYNTLPFLSDRIGHELRTNAETLCAVSGAGMKLNNGIAISSVFSPDPHTHVEIVKYPDNSNAMKLFFGLSVPGKKTSLGRSIGLITKTLSHPWQFIRTLFNFKWSSGLVIFLVMQSIDNSMKMIWKKSMLGGKMKIDNRGNKKVPAYIPVGQDVMEQYAKKVDGVAQNILLEIFFNRPTTAHILGGCPMSETSTGGVISPELKVHGYENFYIMDGSAIQGNIGVNPSLTITAMAEFAMSKIPDREGNQTSGTSNLLLQLEEEWKQKRSV